ncbi:BTB/Kelch-associated [Nannochloropsis gaditana]|uniref:BTB/Kelch-associated n=1 Tax=Nannochloropsis gaditana TaxID=72520 RepID=W7TH60_9STRA|nr:BTB/Kelch-associated [Nannochloropsis gaditana]
MLPETAIELFIAADMYGVERLKRACENVFQTGLNIENAATLLQTAENFNARALKDICLSFIVRHFDQATKTEAFAGLSRELILEVLQSRRDLWKCQDSIQGARAVSSDGLLAMPHHIKGGKAERRGKGLKEGRDRGLSGLMPGRNRVCPRHSCS